MKLSKARKVYEVMAKISNIDFELGISTDVLPKAERELLEKQKSKLLAEIGR